jgi:hypothetical protein
MAEVIERLASLEESDRQHKACINEIFQLLRATADANASTARRQQSTALHLAELTRRINEQHTPDTCPNTATVTELRQALWAGKGILWFVGGGGLAIGTALGIIMR